MKDKVFVAECKNTVSPFFSFFFFGLFFQLKFLISLQIAEKPDQLHI